MSRREQMLRDAGFIHVTGLPFTNTLPQEEGIIRAEENEYGHWNCNGDLIVLVTEDGEVWLGSGFRGDDPFVRQICPKGKGSIQVFCSDGGQIPTELLLKRNHDSHADYEKFSSIF